MSFLSDIVVHLKADATQFRDAMKGAADSINGLSGTFKSMTAEVVGNIARFTSYYVAVGALKNAVGGAIDEFRKLDENMRNVQSITLDSDAAIKDQVKSLLGMVLSGNSAGQSASSLAEAMYEVVSSGYKGADALKIVELSAKGASAGLTTTKQTADALMTILQSYKLPVSEAANVMDQLFTIVDLGRIHFDELNSGMGMVIPTAADLKVPLNEVGAAIELLTRQGQQPSRVMTNLNDVMTRLLKPNDALTAAIEHFGYSSGSAMIKANGLVGTIKLLDEYAQMGGVTTDTASKELLKYADAAVQSDQAVTDHTEAQRRATVAVKNADAALAKLKTTDKGYAAALEKSREAHFNLEKATRELSDAQKNSVGAHDKASTAIQQTGKSAKEADSILAEMMGDVRAIRALLPLAANDGQDFIKMLEDHNREVALGDRMEKALEQQMKAFNYQSKALSSNLKALAAVLIGPVVGGFAGVLTSINNLFKKVAEFDEATGHVVFIWERVPKILEWAKIAAAGLAGAIAVLLIPVVIGLTGAIVGMTMAMLTNPFTWVVLAVAGLVALLQATGKLGTAWNMVKAESAKAFASLKANFEDLAHFLKLGLSGGSIGGEHSPFERMAFNVGEAIHKAIPLIKAFGVELEKIGHLFTLGFQGGQIGGDFSKVEKIAFELGKAVRAVSDWIKDKLIPVVIQFIEGTLPKFFEILRKVFETAKKAINDIAESPSFNTFLSLMGKLGAAIKEVVNRLAEFAQTPLGKKLIQITEYVVAFWAAWVLIVHLPLVVTILAIVAGIYLLFKGIDKVIEISKSLWATFKEVWGKISEFLQSKHNEKYIVEAWDGIKDKLGVIWDGIKQVISNAAAGIYEDIKNWVNDIIDSILGIPGNILNLGEDFVKAGREIMKSFFTGASDFVSSALSGAGSISQTIANSIKRHAIRPALQALDDAIPNKIEIPGLPDINLPDNPINDHVHYSAWASGVRDWMGGLAMLGEQGREMAILPPGTSVATAPQTSQIMDNLLSGGNNGVNVQANFTINGATIDEIITKLHGKVNELDRQMRYRAIRSGPAISGRLS